MRLFRFITKVIFYPFSKICCLVMRSFLSPHTRRILFMTTVYGISQGIRKLDTGDLTRSKTLLDVVYDKDSLEIPALIYSHIWGDSLAKDTGLDVTSLDNFSKSVDTLIKRLPTWIRYGTYERMVSDANSIYEELSTSDNMCFIRQ